MAFSKELFSTISYEEIQVYALAEFLQKQTDVAAKNLELLTTAANVDTSEAQLSEIINQVTDQTMFYTDDEGYIYTVNLVELVQAAWNGTETIVLRRDLDNEQITIDVTDIYEQLSTSVAQLQVFSTSAQALATTLKEEASMRVQALQSFLSINLPNLADSLMSLATNIVSVFSDSANSAKDIAQYIMSQLGLYNLSQSSTSGLIPDLNVQGITGVSSLEAFLYGIGKVMVTLAGVIEGKWAAIKAGFRKLFPRLTTKLEGLKGQINGTNDAFKISSYGHSLFTDYGHARKISLAENDPILAKLSYERYIKVCVPGSDLYFFLEQGKRRSVIILRYWRPIPQSAWEYAQSTAGVFFTDPTNDSWFAKGLNSKTPVENLLKFFTIITNDQLVDGSPITSDENMTIALLNARTASVYFHALALMAPDYSINANINGDDIGFNTAWLVAIAAASLMCSGDDQFAYPRSETIGNLTNVQLARVLIGSNVIQDREVTDSQAKTSWSMFLNSVLLNDDIFTPYYHTSYISNQAMYSVISDAQLAAIGLAIAITVVATVAFVAFKVVTMSVSRQARKAAAIQGATERSLTSELASNDPARVDAAWKQVKKAQFKTRLLSKVASTLGSSTSSLLSHFGAYVGGKISEQVSQATSQLGFGSTIGESQTAPSIATTQDKVDQVIRLIKG